MPTEQLLSASEALSGYAEGLEATIIGPEFLAEVKATHGSLSAEDFIPALTRFVEQHNLLFASLGAKVRLLAQRIGNAARDYLATDAMAAGIIARQG